jgi:carbonic anhydrase
LALFVSAVPASAQRIQLFPRPARTIPAQPAPVEFVRVAPALGVKQTAEQAQQWLEEGNARFVRQQRISPSSELSRVKETAQNGQHPFVTILSCSDSRVPLEVIFDRGVGDIFVIRVAGNVTGESEIGSIEYGVEHVGTPLLIVLGHTKCGAVTAAATHAHTEGHITGLVNRIQPAVEKAKQGDPEITEEELIKRATVFNVMQGITKLAVSSEIIRHLVREDKLKIVGAIYDVETGKVEWLDKLDVKSMVGEH